jgi:protein tyrosine phosphatase (PTP) superfamily phosphohydrolase (DUF442 family)
VYFGARISEHGKDPTSHHVWAHRDHIDHFDRDKHVDDSTFQDVYNYIRVSERIATGGQPSEGQLAAIANAGCTTVINLGLHGADYALPDERGLVESLGMEYIHIPVLWDRPTRADLAQFCETMATYEDRDIFVHCAANKRVSAFIALDRVIRQGWPTHEALKGMDALTFPQVWQAFIDDVLSEHP